MVPLFFFFFFFFFFKIIKYFFFFNNKMADGGWYFCPSEKGDDLASCPYCNLSLDGWEPKDNPL